MKARVIDVQIAWVLNYRYPIHYFLLLLLLLSSLLQLLLHFFLSYLYYLFIRLALTSTHEEHPIWLEQATGRNTGQGSCIMLQTFLLQTLHIVAIIASF